MADPARTERPSPAAAPPPRPSRAARGRSERGSRWLALGMLALAVFAGWLAWRTSQLQAENRALASDLVAARAQVEAWRTHMAGARERAGDLRGRLDELEAWLAREPGARGSAPAPTR